MLSLFQSTPDASGSPTALNRAVAFGGWLASAAGAFVASRIVTLIPALHGHDSEIAQIASAGVIFVTAEVGRIKWLHGASVWERLSAVLSSPVVQNINADASLVLPLLQEAGVDHKTLAEVSTFLTTPQGDPNKPVPAAYEPGAVAATPDAVPGDGPDANQTPAPMPPEAPPTAAVPVSAPPVQSPPPQPAPDAQPGSQGDMSAG